jgi:hypothetical protein
MTTLIALIFLCPLSPVRGTVELTSCYSHEEASVLVMDLVAWFVQDPNHPSQQREAPIRGPHRRRRVFLRTTAGFYIPELAVAVV